VAYRFATDGTSEMQLDLLAQAKRKPDPARVNHILKQVLLDTDLTSGQEPLHPEWFDFIRSNLQLLPQFVPKALLEALVGAVQPVSPVLNGLDPRTLKVSFLLVPGRPSRVRPRYRPLRNFSLTFFRAQDGLTGTR